MYTDEEAKNKQCPMTRNIYSDSSGVSVGHNDKTDVNSYCVGSACMMWKQYERGEKLKDWVGYCGLKN